MSDMGMHSGKMDHSINQIDKSLDDLSAALKDAELKRKKYEASIRDDVSDQAREVLRKAAMIIERLRDLEERRNRVLDDANRIFKIIESN